MVPGIMKLKISFTSKLLFSLGFISCLTGCESQTVVEVMHSQIGLSESEIINKWGFPTEERVDNGRELLIWTETEISYEGVPRLNVEKEITDNIEFEGVFLLGEGRQLTCSRIVELGAENTVVNASATGSNCPRFAPSSW